MLSQIYLQLAKLLGFFSVKSFGVLGFNGDLEKSMDIPQRQRLAKLYSDRSMERSPPTGSGLHSKKKM
jgi:hypothetical protein